MRFTWYQKSVAGCSLMILAGGVALAGEKTAVSAEGMVAAAHPLAVQAGVEMLEKGGNAVDAAAAAAFAVLVVEPFGSSLGGDGLSIVYSAEDGKKRAYSYRCEAPGAANYTIFDYDTSDEWVKSPLGPAVPGMVAGTVQMHEDFGVLPLEEILQPAIRYARDGFTVGPTLASIIADNYAVLVESEAASQVYLIEDFPPEAGATLTNPDLAKSLELIGEQGAGAMYNGPLGQAISEYLLANGGVITTEDFANYDIIVSEPLMVQYRDYSVFSVPPPGGGIAVLESLQLLEHLDLNTADSAFAPENVLLMIKAMKYASEDRSEVSGDPRFVEVPTDWVLSEEYSALRVAEMDLSKAEDRYDIDPGPVWAKPDYHGSTTHLSVVDGDGNAVSLTQTLGAFFGSGVMVPGTGIMLNDQMKNFSSRETSPNAMAPGKSMNSTQSPTLVSKDGELVLAIGSPGNYRILTTVFQVLVYLLDFDMELQEALDAPRFSARDRYAEVSMESRFPEEVYTALQALGYKLDVMGEFDLYFGGVHAVLRDPETGMLYGAADRRRDGAAGGAGGGDD